MPAPDFKPVTPKGQVSAGELRRVAESAESRSLLAASGVARSTQTEAGDTIHVEDPWERWGRITGWEGTRNSYTFIEVVDTLNTARRLEWVDNPDGIRSQINAATGRVTYPAYERSANRYVPVGAIVRLYKGSVLPPCPGIVPCLEDYFLFRYCSNLLERRLNCCQNVNGPQPATLHATFFNLSSCPCLDGVVVPLTQVSGGTGTGAIDSSVWQFPPPGSPDVALISCGYQRFSILIQCYGNGCVNLAAQVNLESLSGGGTVNCDVLSVRPAFAMAGCTCDPFYVWFDLDMQQKNEPTQPLCPGVPPCAGGRVRMFLTL